MEEALPEIFTVVKGKNWIFFLLSRCRRARAAVRILLSGVGVTLRLCYMLSGSCV